MLAPADVVAASSAATVMVHDEAEVDVVTEGPDPSATAAAVRALDGRRRTSVSLLRSGGARLDVAVTDEGDHVVVHVDAGGRVGQLVSGKAGGDGAATVTLTAARTAGTYPRAATTTPDAAVAAAQAFAVDGRRDDSPAWRDGSAAEVVELPRLPGAPDRR